MNRSGQSLVQVMVAVALMGVLTAAFTTMFTNLNRENRALYEKIAFLNTQSQLVNLLSDGQICDFELNTSGTWLPGARPITFNAATIASPNPPVINLTQVLSAPAATAGALFQVGQPLSPDNPSLVIQSIQIGNLSGNPGDDRFPATLTITIDPTRLSRPIRPINAKIVLLTSGAGPNKTVTGCTRSASGSATAGARLNTTITNLHTFHPSCGPASGYSWFDSPVGSGSLSSGALLHHCLTACSRYCRSQGYSGGTMSEYNEPGDIAVCDCTP